MEANTPLWGLIGACGLTALMLATPALAAPQGARPIATLRCGAAVWRIGPDATTLGFRLAGADLAIPGKPIASARTAGVETTASAARMAGGELEVQFGAGGTAVRLRLSAQPQFGVVEVVSISGPIPESLTFVDIPLTLKALGSERLAATALALNLRTNVVDLPGRSTRLQASCEQRFGFKGARAALIGAPFDRMRSALKAAVASTTDLPGSALGGPNALDAAGSRGSYLFNFGDMTVERADDWIRLAHELGVTQIDFHGGGSFRFGDCEPNPVTYPHGRADFKAVIDKLHAAGIQAGLHTYAFFIDKRCPWVTPKPDPRLAKSASFTLADDLSLSATAVKVNETTAGVSAITGFFVRNGATIQIDDELITFSGAGTQQPFGFTGCVRGACGTRPASHARGAAVHQLKECFGLFVPDPKTDMLAEVAARTADMYNACGFDMIYLDALDGEDILGGGDAQWHYGSAFVYEIARRLSRPALMEMSTFHHHLWVVRSRMGAWDHPNRSHKAFIDLHVKGNDENGRMFLPGQLGWWALKTWVGAEGEPTWSDDIEYLMAKCAGSDTGFALMGIDPTTFRSVPALPRLARVIRRWETLRHSGRISPSVKARLREPGAEFTLTEGAGGAARLAEVRVLKQRVDATDDRSRQWNIANPWSAQPLRVRVEALTAINRTVPGKPLCDPADPSSIPGREAAGGITASLTAGSGGAPAEGPQRYGVLRVTSALSTARGSWARFDRPFETPVNIADRRALGVWVRGDGLGEVLNLQLRCPAHIVAGLGEHYITIDFTGWRYFELVEPEGVRWADFSWPYGNPYSIYREAVEYGAIAGVSIWINNVPAGRTAEVAVGQIMALATGDATLSHPVLAVGGQKIEFPVEIATGGCLEYDGGDRCSVFGPKGEVLSSVEVIRPAPVVAGGASAVAFTPGAASSPAARSRVTLFLRGKPFSPAGRVPTASR